MRARLDDIRAAGADLAFVGSGSPRLAARFQRTHTPGCTVLTDPSLKTYAALGLKRGVTETLGPSTWGAAIRALAGGHLQTAVQGDPWQQGGTFALARGGEVVYAHRNRHAGDRPDVDAALAALGMPARDPAGKRASGPQSGELSRSGGRQGLSRSARKRSASG